MMDNPILDNLSKHLTENHDADWRYEYIDYDGLAFNCYLPTDSPETYLIVDASHYTIRETGKNVPQGLIDEVLTILNDSFILEVGWNQTNNPEKWA
tara:strand:- start:1715 stop:2002 length:288 start_codon:yes stop_codon:yes gene_type:complete